MPWSPCSSNLPCRRSNSQGVYEAWRSRLENPTWRGVIRVVTGAATLTGIDSIGQLNIGMTLLTEAGNYFWVL
jgi:hypothetical protein